MRELTSTAQIILNLGGDRVLAKLLDTTHKAVGNWRCWNKFPANTYVAIQTELAARDLSAPSRLWAMKKTKRAPGVSNADLDKAGRGPVRAAIRRSG